MDCLLFKNMMNQDFKYVQSYLLELHVCCWAVKYLMGINHSVILRTEHTTIFVHSLAEVSDDTEHHALKSEPTALQTSLSGVISSSAVSLDSLQI